MLTGFLFSCNATNAQSIYKKNKEIYFNLEEIGKDIPYVRGGGNQYSPNDSIIYDIKFNKVTKRLHATSYKKKAYYGNGYASPISYIKYKVARARVDTTLTNQSKDGKRIYSINKHFNAKILNRVDYFKYKSK